MSTKTKDKTELILNTIVNKTLEWTKDEYNTVELQTPKAKRLSQHLSEMTLGATDKMKLAVILSIATGETVRVVEEEDIKLRVLTAIVCTKAEKHNYETGQVLVSVGDGTAVDPTGKVGGFIKPSRTIVRPATTAEMKLITPTQIKGLLDYVAIEFISSKD